MFSSEWYDADIYEVIDGIGISEFEIEIKDVGVFRCLKGINA